MSIELTENEKKALFEPESAFTLVSSLSKILEFIRDSAASIRGQAADKNINPGDIVSGENMIKDEHLRYGQFWKIDNGDFSIFAGFDFSLANYRKYQEYRKYSEYVFSVSFKKDVSKNTTASSFEDAIEVDGWIYVRMGNASFLEKQKFVDKFMEVINKLIPQRQA